ncbi:aldehyde dehydrogenase family protein [Sphingobium sp. WTD-1]|nr:MULTISPECIES: aldehyde dehydrogenase family protein [Sphingomonadaceae]QKR98460.1 aldehyde dehydrogenase family protein [Sphingomonas sp. CL5.1]WIA57766.1 aldehyde dehydrogenase family protein [Sphingobium sp. WTD-1]
MENYRMLVGGSLIDGDEMADVINPATATVVAKAPVADAAIVEAAVSAAHAAFASWSIVPQAERGQLVAQLASGIEAQSAKFARLLVEEQGKPLGLAEMEVGQTVYILRAFASMETTEEVLRDNEGERIVEHRTPLGVVAMITPWNFPLLLLATKLAPGLTAGNCVVVKPAPSTPLTTLLLGELCADIFPAGVVNIINGPSQIGALLTEHPLIAKIAFTGSTSTGRHVMASAASTIKRLTLELGGNDAAIVMNDIDPEEVAERIFAGAMVNSGQVCVAIKRVYVHENVYDAVCERLAALAEAAVVGDGFSQGVQFGPLQNEAQFARAKEFLREAARDGTIIAGGDPIDRPGYFIPPTIVRDIDDSARLVTEEQFAPILPILKYVDLDDVIARANFGTFGLAASVWGKDLDAAYGIAQKLDAGTVWVNKHFDLPPDVPFRGAKQSGLGAELGREGMAEYSQPKIINMATQ